MSVPITAAAGASDVAQPKKTKKSIADIFYPKKKKD